MADKEIFDFQIGSAPALTDYLPVGQDPSGVPVLRKQTLQTIQNLLMGTGSANGDFTVYNGSAWSKKTLAEVKTLLGVGTRYLYIPAEAFHPASTAGCADIATLEASTNKQSVKYLAFDASTDENADVTFAFPPIWDGGTITATAYWTHPSTTTNFKVDWGVKGRAYANDDALDQSFGTAVETSDTGGTTSDIYIGPESSAITLAGTPVGGQLVTLRVYRDADDATNDTLAVDAYFIGVLLKYTVS